MKNNINLSMSDGEITALEVYLAQRNTSLKAELDKYIGQLYSENVPQNIREYIELVLAKKKLEEPVDNWQW